MTGGTDFATIADLANYVDLTTNQTITSGIKSFTALPQSSATPTIANQLVNKNYVDGNFVTLTTGQTITGQKIFNSNVRLNNTRQLIFGTSSPANINYTLPNLYYDITGGGHYFFIGGSPNLYIDTDGLNIESGKRIYFNGKRCSIRDSGTQLISDVPTNNSHSFRINNVEKFKISNDANGTILTFPSGIVIREYTSFDWFLHEIPFGFQYKWDIDGDTKLEVETNEIRPAVRINMKNNSRLTWWEGYTTNEAYITKNTTTSTFDYDVATGYKHKWSVNGTQVLTLGDSSYGLRSENNVFILNNKWIYWDAFNNGIQCDASGNMNYQALATAQHRFFIGAARICNVDAAGIQMGVSTLPAAFPRFYTDYSRNNWITGDLTNLIYNCSNNGGNGTHNFKRNSVDIAFLNQFALNMPTDNCALAMGTTGGQFILQHDSAGLAGQYRIPSGWVHNFQIGGVGYAQIRAEGFYSFQNNTALQLGNTNQIKIRHDPANTAMSLEIPGGFSYDFYIGGALFYEFREDTLRALRGYQCKAGATGVYVSNNFNYSWNVPVGGLNVYIDNTRLGNMSIVSDYRIKENIVPARPVLDRLCKIKTYEYEFKNISIFKKNGLSHGFIAHEVAELFPELSNIILGEKDELTPDGDIQPQSVGGEFTNLYLSAIQELNVKCETQKAQIETQQTQMEAMQKQIDGLVLALSKIVSP